MTPEDSGFSELLIHKRFWEDIVLGSVLKLGVLVCPGGSDVSRDAGDGEDLAASEEIVDDEIAGTSKLEVENAWLKSELASAVAMLCNLDPDFELEEGEGDSQDPERGGGEAERLGEVHTAAQRTAEALHLKDEHAKHLHSMLAMRQVCDQLLIVHEHCYSVWASQQCPSM